MKEFTIAIDNREKQPLPIGEGDLNTNHTMWLGGRRQTVRITTISRKLKTGDYQLLPERGGAPAACIERKKSLNELAGNYTSKRAAFIRELARLRSEFEFPAILVEGSPLSLEKSFTSYDGQRIPGYEVRDRLLQSCQDYNIQLFLLDRNTAAARRATARWMISYLILAQTACKRRPSQTGTMSSDPVHLDIPPEGEPQ